MKCPRCNKEIIGYPAISRVDNLTEICSDCGLDEALSVYGFSKFRRKLFIRRIKRYDRNLESTNSERR